MRRVVITGLGVVSCLGNNQEEVHQSLLNSKSGISFAEEYKEHNLKSHVHGKPNIKLEDHIDRKTIRSVSYTHLRAHETRGNLVCRLLLEKKIYSAENLKVGLFK